MSDIGKAEVFSWLRAMSGGKLTDTQVTNGDKIINTLGLETFSGVIGYPYLTSKDVTGQWDISDAGYALIKESEGLKLTAYQDTGGVWTIGYGTIKINGVAVKKGDTITKEKAEACLKADCAWVDKCLDSSIKVKVSQNQFDALASFVYNIGETQFKSSTLLRKLNSGDYIGASNEFGRWVNDNGKRVQGLVNRREKEKALFLSK